MNSVEDIVYNLYKYGMSVDDISLALNVDGSKVQKYILESKLKATASFESNEKIEFNILQKLITLDRPARLSIIGDLDNTKLAQLNLEIEKYFQNENLNVEDVMSVLWIIGELKTNKFNTILKNKSLSYNGNIKRMAISAMGKILDPTFEPYLKQCCKDNKPQVRSYAIKAFAKLNSPDKLKFLDNLYPNETVEYNKKLIERIIKEG